MVKGADTGFFIDSVYFFKEGKSEEKDKLINLIKLAF